MILFPEEKQAADVELWIEDQCRQLVRQCIFELNENEKQVWLWNAMVTMKKIMARRNKYPLVAA